MSGVSITMRTGAGPRSLCLCITLSACAFTASYAVDRPCYIYETSKYGFGSNFFGLLMAVATFGANNSTVYIEESTWAYKCGGKPSWNEFFAGKQPQPRPRPNEAYEAHQALNACTSLCYDSGYQRLKDLTVAHVRPLLGKALRDMWTLTPRVQELADVQAAFLDTLQHPILAVHVRGGDKRDEDLMSKLNPEWYNSGEWLSSLTEHLELFQLAAPATCLIFGDGLQANAAVAATASQNLSCNVLQLGGRDGGHQQDLFSAEASASQSTDGQDLGCVRTQDFILNLVTMARADLFVGSYNSNVGRLVHLLRSYVYPKPAEATKDLMYREWHHDHLHGYVYT